MNTAARIVSSFGSDLIEADYQRLEARWITPVLPDDAGIRRVDSLTGREMFGRKTGDLAGIIIPYVLPGEDRPVEYRLRVDHPELEYRIDGSVRETKKYIQPAGPRQPGLLPAGPSDYRAGRSFATGEIG